MSQQQPIQSQPSGQLTDSTQSRQGVQVQQGSGTQQARPAAGTGQLVPTRNYLDQSVRQSSIDTLTQCLADLTTVNMQLKTAHWNVRGPNFYQLHELFEEIVESLEPLVDTVAERATALGGHAPGTAPMVAQRSTVPQLSPTTSDEAQLVEQLADSLAALDASLYDGINRVSEQGDLDTADLLNEVSREVSKSLWLVEAHLQGRGIGTAQGQQSTR